MPHEATHQEWENWRREVKTTHRAVYWFLETAPDWLRYTFWRPPQRAWDWLRNRLYPRYRPIIRTGLEPGWHDADQMILHGCMAMLCRYVEDEIGGVDEVLERARWLGAEAYDHEDVPQGFHDREISALKRIAEIYHWWKQYPGDPESGLEKGDEDLWDRFDELATDERKNLVKKYWAAAVANRAKEDEMLKKLIDVRHGMWT